MSEPSRQRRPSMVSIKNALAAVKAERGKVSGLRVHYDGSFEVLTVTHGRRHDQKTAAEAYDEWKAKQLAERLD